MAFSSYPAKGGVPSGNTAARPSSPVTGDTFYNGTLAQLEIWTGSAWEPCSAVPGQPTLSVADVGTNIAYGAAQGAVTITPPTNGGLPSSYLVSSSTGGYTATTTGTTTNITVGNNGDWTFSGISFNDFGNGVTGPSTTATLTTKPQAPTAASAAISGSSTDVTVSWTLGSNGGKALSSITITPFLNGTTAQTPRTAATTSSTSYVFTGGTALTSGSSYTFKVKTTNANGDSLETTTSSITVPTIVTVDFLVIAGGGGGGQWRGGGGGAGGYRTSTGTSGGNSSAESALSVVAGTNFTVTVGAGGAGGTSSTNGSNSVLSSVTSIGGGRAGSGFAGQPSGSAGSGGGNSWHYSGSGGPGTTGQGTSGGSTNTGVNRSAGGGGAGQAGFANNDGGNPGKGGNGLSNSITGSAVTRGGGGGGSREDDNPTISPGGTGGGGQGGDGDNSPVATAGTANTGGGGGGIHADNIAGVNGGSGVVIIKYPDTFSATVGGGLTSSETSSGGFKIRTFTAGTGNVSLA
jgi:hypothetical protein